MIILYGDLLSQPTRAVAIFCATNQIEYQLQFVNLSKGEHKRPDYLAINPRGLIPAISDHGFNLAESASILRYLAGTRSVPDHWYPIDFKKRARVDSLLDWYHTNLRKAKGAARARFQTPPANEEEVLQHKLNTTAALKFLEEELLLASGAFLQGASQPSIADLLLTCEVTQLLLLEKAEYEELVGSKPRTLKWLEAMENAVAPHFHELHKRVHDGVAILEKKRQEKKAKL